MRAQLVVISFVLLAVSQSISSRRDTPSLHNLDNGLQWQFVTITLKNGEEYIGQVIGVYNEANFMWHPTPYSNLVIFTCQDSTMDLHTFSVVPGETPSVFSVSSDVIESINMETKPEYLVEYQEYLRIHDYSFHNTPVEGEVWVSNGWKSYHQWEDGRGNYAWDLGALNDDMLSYEHYGLHNRDFTVWEKNVQLPMSGKVVTAVDKEIDNEPDLVAAVDLNDRQDGEGVDLEEKPQNMVEVQVGGDSSPFLLRLLHLRQNSLPSDIKVGSNYSAGTLVGQVGNSGTTFVPHCHAVWGFTDNNNRYWSLPIQWKDAAHRIILPYPRGYEYGNYHHHDYFYPKTGFCVTN